MSIEDWKDLSEPVAQRLVEHCLAAGLELNLEHGRICYRTPWCASAGRRWLVEVAAEGSTPTTLYLSGGRADTNTRPHVRRWLSTDRGPWAKAIFEELQAELRGELGALEARVLAELGPPQVAQPRPWWRRLFRRQPALGRLALAEPGRGELAVSEPGEGVAHGG